MILALTSADEYWHLHHSGCRHSLIYAYTSSRTCYFSLASLILTATIQVYCYRIIHRAGHFYVLLTVHLSIFISVINQLNAQILFIISLLYASTCFEHCCAHHQEVKIVLNSVWYHHICRWPSRVQSFLNPCMARPPTGVMIPDAV